MEDTLPKSGLPTHPAAFNFDLDENGNISGLG
jgi:formyltetrahydrofolate synthetase